MVTEGMDKGCQPKNLYETIIDKKAGKPLKAIVRGWRERNPMVWASCLSDF